MDYRRSLNPLWITGRPPKGSIPGVQIFDKALTEVTFTELYAELCVQLSAALPGFEDLDEKSDGPKKLSVTFRRRAPFGSPSAPSAASASVVYALQAHLHVGSNLPRSCWLV